MIASYLQRYAEPEAVGAAALDVSADTAVVVPLRGEDDVRLWESLERAAARAGVRAVAIALVNADEAQAEWVHAANARTLERLGRYRGERLTIVTIDRASAGRRFAPREGVGHARKLGCDVAVALHAAGKVRSEWIATTDGDAQVAEDYFLFRPEPADAALVHPFRHTVENGESRSLLLYEVSLRYYVLSLRAAGSPYAFHTIGSTFRFPARSYAAVRGFPKREAAEDFYFLDKLSKVGRVRPDGGRVILSARESARVPFGTGRSMARIGAELAAGETFQMYHPMPFQRLGEWLRAVNDFDGDADATLASLSQETRRVVEAQGAREALAIAERTRKSAADRRRHLHTWFDGLKTLKFLHALRDHGYPKLPWREALRGAALPCPAEEVAVLEALRALDEGF